MTRWQLIAFIILGIIAVGAYSMDEGCDVDPKPARCVVGESE